MAKLDLSSIKFPYDPIINTIVKDARNDQAFKKSIAGMGNIVVWYRNTIHPTDQLLDTWYRFKENRTCQHKGV